VWRPASTSKTTEAVAAVAADELLLVGRIVKAHGLTGEVVVDLLTDRTERLDPGAALLRRHGGALLVRSRRPHQGRWLVVFDHVATREAAEALRGQELLAPPIEGDDGTIWVHELVGSRVLDGAGRPLGTVVAVEKNPASDLLVLDGGALVPLRFVEDHVPGESVTVVVPEGLLELAAPAPTPTTVPDATSPPAAPSGTASGGDPSGAAPDRAAPDRAVPDSPAPDSPAPDSPVPDSAAPDSPVPDRAAPDSAAPDRAVPDSPAPDRPGPDRHRA
jgi:16S rRNA processing protein RimM